MNESKFIESSPNT